MNINFKKELKPFLLSTFGIAFFALCVDLISWQFKLVTGGLTGYALILNYVTGVSVGTGLLIGNTVILLVSFLIVGKTAGIRGIYGYVILSFFIDFFKNVFGLHQIVETAFFTNLFLVVLQGSVASFFVSFVMISKYSFGSYSSIYPIISKYKKISYPLFFFAMDFLLSLLATYLYGWQKGILLLANAGAFFVTSKLILPILNKRIKFT